MLSLVWRRANGLVESLLALPLKNTYGMNMLNSREKLAAWNASLCQLQTQLCLMHLAAIALIACAWQVDRKHRAAWHSSALRACESWQLQMQIMIHLRRDKLIASLAKLIASFAFESLLSKKGRCRLLEIVSWQLEHLYSICLGGEAIHWNQHRCSPLYGEEQMDWWNRCWS